MDLSANLHISKKGEEEVRSRVYKLGIKKRSILILLDKPRTTEYVARKSVLPQMEIIDEIQALIQEGFISFTGEGSLETAVAVTAQGASALGKPEKTFHFEDDIILSEAKFLLTDFCVDSFGTKSQSFVDEIRGCANATHLGNCLQKIFIATNAECQQRLPVLAGIVKDINETA